MKVSSGKWKWCTAISVMAVGFFAFSVTLRGAPVEKWSNDAKPAKVTGEKVRIGPGIPQSGLRVLPPMRGDYRKDATVTRTQGELVAIGPWPISRSSVASMNGCGTDEQCSDCNYCTQDTCDTETGLCSYENLTGLYLGCDDDTFCNGEELCNGATGYCDPASNPCTGSEVCDEEEDVCKLPECTTAAMCSDGYYCTDDICNADGICEHPDAAACGPGGECNEPIPPATGPACVEGRCCVGTYNPSVPNPATCSAATYAACNTAGGKWIPTDDACLVLVPSGALNDCPDYSSGIAPQGAYVTGVGPISSLTHENCGDAAEVGDDYQTDDYPANLYMEIELLRFVGNVMSEYSARWRIAFYSANGDLVEDLFWPDGQDQDPTFDFVVNTVDFDPPLVIPTNGYVAWSVQPNFSPGGRVMLMSTTSPADVGTNNAGGMWYNGAATTGYLAPDPDILAFEIVGTVTTAPIGACCTPGGTCVHTLPWECDGKFRGVGTVCALCTNQEPPGYFLEPCDDDADCGGVVDACQDQICDQIGNECDTDEDCTQSGEICINLATACLTQACCHADGTCEEVIAPIECPVGTTSLGFGTDCNLDDQVPGSRSCCEQTPTGGDNCMEVTMHVIQVPAVGGDPVSVTITGNNSAATFDDYPEICDIWAPESLERGWWEGFSIDACANVRLDLCCTSVYGEPLRPAWGNLVYDCPCGGLLQNDGVPPPIGIGIGTTGFARGMPFCAEDNLWQTFGPIPAGSYFYPIYTVPDGTSGVPPGGPYQMHITVGACPTAACCTQDTCAVLNQLDCAAADGYWLHPPNVITAVATCSPSNPCVTGSCCTGPGQCLDKIPPGVEPMNKATCLGYPGEYVGGALCSNQGNPCPVCEMQKSSNCQLLSATVATVTMSDLSAPGGAVARADDFVAKGNAITTVCAWGAYLDGSKPDGEFGCSEDVTDLFRVTVYGDAGGMPDDQNIIGTSLVNVLDRAEYPDADMNNANRTYYEQVYGDNVGEPMFAYQMALTTPITGMVMEECYWLEIVNYTESPEGQPLNTCEWNWAHTDGNDYSFAGTYTGDPPTVPVYNLGGERASDMAFCLDCGIGEGGCGEETKRTCCTCYDPGPPTCTTKTLENCVGAMWDMGEDSCTGYQCDTTAPTGDTCPNAIVIGDGSYNFNSMCADTNGPAGAGKPWLVRNENGGLTGFGSEIWYKYVSPCTGRLQISQCGSGSSDDTFDGMIAVFRNAANPTACLCPGQTGFIQDGNGDDETCTGIADGGQGLQLRTTVAGYCWMIAAGGFEAAGGPGSMNVECITADCTMAPQPLEAPLSGLRDGGFGSRVRYLAFRAAGKAGERGLTTAIRVKFTDLPPPFEYAEGRTMWIGAPTDVSEVAGSLTLPPTFKLSELVCDPFFTDWTQYGTVYVRSVNFVPRGVYDVQAIADDCPMLEGNFSPALVVGLSKWGDTVGAAYWNWPQGTVNFDDISSVVAKFKNLATAPVKARVDVAPRLPDRIVDFQDIPAVVDAFRGLVYPYTAVLPPCP